MACKSLSHTHSEREFYCVYICICIHVYKIIGNINTITNKIVFNIQIKIKLHVTRSSASFSIPSLPQIFFNTFSLCPCDPSPVDYVCFILQWVWMDFIGTALFSNQHCRGRFFWISLIFLWKPGYFWGKSMEMNGMELHTLIQTHI